MEMFLYSDPESLTVVDAVSLIAGHIVGRDPQPVPLDWGSWHWIPPPLYTEQVPNIALMTSEHLWTGRIRVATAKGALPLYDPAGFSTRFNPETFERAHVRQADLAQWLVETFNKTVVLDGVRVKQTQIRAKAGTETLRRKILVKRYSFIWKDIDADLKEGSWNGLKKAAGLEHGYYNVLKVLEWGRRRGKLATAGLCTPTPSNDLQCKDD